MIKKTSIISLLFLFCYFLPTSCFEPEEGCLDIEANNFQLAADRDCSKDAPSNCFCTYPSVSLQVVHIFDKFDFRTDTVYRINSGEIIKIQDIQFYISDIQLIMEDDRIVQTLDTITLTVQENGEFQNKIILDDFHLIQLENKTINTLITTNQSGTFTQLQFSVGIKFPASTTQPDQVERGSHVLEIDSLFSEETGYIFNQLLIQPDTASVEVLVVQLTESDSLPRIILEDNIVAIKQQGRNVSLGTLQINHAKWFDGINFVENTEREIRHQIVINTTNVFTILQ